MYFRTRKRDNGKVTIAIVETVRTGERVHQKTLSTVATVLHGEAFRIFLEDRNMDLIYIKNYENEFNNNQI